MMPRHQCHQRVGPPATCDATCDNSAQHRRKLHPMKRKHVAAGGAATARAATSACARRADYYSHTHPPPHTALPRALPCHLAGFAALPPCRPGPVSSSHTRAHTHARTCARTQVSLCKDKGGVTRPCINGKYRFLAGFLDQSWFPDGQYLAPGDEVSDRPCNVRRQGE